MAHAHAPTQRPRHFASDTYAPICSAAFAAIQAVNHDHAIAYGDDQYTAKSVEAVRTCLSAPTAEIFFVSSGTVGNALTLASMVQPFQSVGMGPPHTPESPTVVTVGGTTNRCSFFLRCLFLDPVPHLSPP